jgi:hypothetical protein
MIYEFITPSDPITFKTEDDKIAYACSVLLGSGKAGCHNKDTNVNLGTILMFDPDPDSTIKEFLGMDFEEFIEANKLSMAECFESFAYGRVGERKNYEDALVAITDPEKAKEFKLKHEDRNRSSMSKWVQSAWRIAENLRKEVKQNA